MRSLCLTVRSVALATWVGAAACSSAPESPPPDTPSEPAPQQAEPAPSPDVMPPDTEADPTPPTDLKAALIGLEGKVRVNGKPAKVGRGLKVGDQINAGKKSWADVELTGGSRIRLAARSKLTIKDEGPQFSVRLALGKLYSLIAPGTRYQVQTSNAVAGIRGTAFFVEEKKNKSYFCVCEGEIGVKGPKDDTETVLKAGFDLSVSKRKKTGAPKASPSMMNMVNSVFEEMKESTP